MMEARHSPNTPGSTNVFKSKTVKDLYKDLEKKMEEISVLGSISSILSWDQQTMMPSGAAELRGKQLSILAGLIHDKTTDVELGHVLGELKARQPEHVKEEIGEYEIASIHLSQRSHLYATRTPKHLALRIAELQVSGYETWAKAREASDWKVFEPVLLEWVEIGREVAKCRDPSKDVYDALLDEFERGLTSARLDEIFSYLKKELIPLIRSVTAKPPPDTSFLQGEFSVDEQVKLNHRIAKELGFDTDSGRLDTSIHPFTGGVGPFDVRMTTRYRSDSLLEGITGTVHETGHSLYEQGRKKEYATMPVSEALSMGVHESQSLLWERMVCLSPAFWQHYLPLVKTHFPQIKTDGSGNPVGVQEWTKAVNEVKAGFIRVDADELTYPLHIILRYEIERDLIRGKLSVSDVPRVWNEKMKEYLGLEVTSDKIGVLQDVHWSGGAIGYFPTYTLGAIMACMFFKQAEKSLPNLHKDISSGTFSPLREWLKSSIHEKGSLYSSADELCEHVCAKKLDPSEFVAYLKEKFGKLYGL